MFKLNVRAASGEYTVTIGQNLLATLDLNETVIIIDSNLHDLALSTERSIALTAGENLKNLKTCEAVISEMKRLGCNRETKVIAIGGGFVQDISTLVSALYMRGIKWTFVPTTLMAMMDSCIGGKSAINVGNSKNLIGNFYPPSEILLDTDFISTLPESAIASGLAEGVKICYARGGEFFEMFCDLRSATTNFNSSQGMEIINLVLNSKKWFIEEDEFDAGVRQLLNFGHTFGHALESATGFAIPHGVAICYGMLAALHHPKSKISNAENILKNECLSILAPVAFEYQSTLSEVTKFDFMRAFQNDKKHSAEEYRLILPGLFGLEVVNIPRSSDSLDEIFTAFQHALNAVYK